MQLRLHRIAIALVILLAFALEGALHAQSAAPHLRSARLLGVFASSDGIALPNVEVIDLLGRTTMRTSVTGTVSLGFVQVQHDSGVIQVRKFGYRDTTFLVPLSASDTTPITLLLERLTVLDTIAVRENISGVTAGMRIFDAHRKGPYGKFVTPGELRSVNDGRDLDDYLLSKGFKEANRVCALYVNGIRYSAMPPGMAKFVGDLEAIEYYASKLMAPPGYDAPNRSAHCAVLVLWTRER